MVFFLRFTPHVILKTSLIGIGSDPDKLFHHPSQGMHQVYSWLGTKEFHGLQLLFLRVNKEKLSELQNTVRFLPQYLSGGMNPILWQDRHQPSSLHEEKFCSKRVPPQYTNLFTVGFPWNLLKVLMINPLNSPKTKVLFKATLVLP